MFTSSSVSGAVKSLPSSLTNVDAMFRETKITSIPSTLPSGLTNGYQMFYICSNLSGTIPTLPASLENAENIFARTNLSGTAPKFSSMTNLTDYCSAFEKESTNTGTIANNSTSSWPYSAWLSSCEKQDCATGALLFTDGIYSFKLCSRILD